MFYFPIVSSSAEIGEYKEVLRTKLRNCLRDMELLVRWEETLNREMMKFDKPPEHKELFKMLSSFVETGN